MVVIGLSVCRVLLILISNCRTGAGVVEAVGEVGVYSYYRDHYHSSYYYYHSSYYHYHYHSSYYHYHYHCHSSYYHYHYHYHSSCYHYYDYDYDYDYTSCPNPRY